MSRIDFAVVGGGWRTEFFLRIARALPDRFRITALLVRDPAKGAALTAAWGVPAVTDLDALLATGPGFVIVSVPGVAAPGYIAQLAARDVPVLTETPPATSLEGLLELWRLVEKGARIQVAEQYIYQPLHAARLAIARSGRLGQVTYAHVSSCHGYHGTSLIRHFLGLGFENATVTARAFESDIIAGPGRMGGPPVEKVSRSRQVIAQLDFGTKLGVYDFTGDQYFSWIRSLSVLLRGSHGELRDMTLRYLEDFATPVEQPLLRQDKGHNGNLEGLWHRGILAGAQWVYRNPFPYAPLCDDEIAIATALSGMHDYVNGGPPVYSFAEAAQDQMLSLAIEEALTTGKAVTTATQLWAGP